MLLNSLSVDWTLNQRVPGSSPGALANRTFPIRLRIGRFCGDFRPLTSWILVSADVRAFLVAILALCLCIQKFRSRQPGLEHEVGPHCTLNSDFWAAVIRDLRPGLQPIPD